MKKRKLKTFVYIFIILILVIILCFIFIFKSTGSKKYYSKEAINYIKKENIKNIYQYDYSKTLDEVIKSNNFNASYLDEYLNITYQDQTDFINKLNNYLSIGYSANEINNIFKLSLKNQDKLLSLSKQNDFIKYVGIKNFNINNLDRYNKYLEENNKDIQTTVTYVNINLDKEFYTDSIEINPDGDLTVIVNKYHHLAKDYVPKDMVVLFDSNRGAKMIKEAADAYKEFIEGAKNAGITLESTTAYRSYSYQNTLYTNYVNEDGKEKADTYSARPGSSEHQLGLAVDLNDPNVSGSRLDDKDYEWILNNSYKYGFIVRYTKDNEPITGYMEEPWHIRYLGIDLATKVYNSKLTYEEYYDLYIAEY